MKKWEIKYQRGNDILITDFEMHDDFCQRDVMAQFYMTNPNCDIISIEEVT